MAKDSGVQDQWIFPTLRNGLTAMEKRLVIAKVLKTSTLAMFKTHTYSFGGKYYLQVKGGPIGLKSTCCIARLVMLLWDDQLMVAMMKLNISTVSEAGYMDDVRLFLRGVRLERSRGLEEGRGRGWNDIIAENHSSTEGCDERDMWMVGFNHGK